MGWIWAALAASWLFLLYLFLMAPNFLHPKARTQMLAGLYAHRGLHGPNDPENSLPAFQKAVDKGYGVELDVHMTQDGHMVVHHDDTLKRTCGVDQRIQDMTLEEVRSCRMLGGTETIPTLEEALAVIDGRVPLIVEMKSDGPAQKRLPELLYRRMRGYSGVWCVESFDPRMIRWYKKNAPNVIRGQLAFNPYRLPGDERRGCRYFAAARLLMNVLSRPDFVAYGFETAGNLSFRLMRWLFCPVLAAWTVTSPEIAEKLKKTYDILIFEAFEPNINDPVMDQKEKEKES